MSLYIVFPSYDKEYPATLSYKILTKLLREDLHFKGLIATDCLQMKAIQNHFSTPEAALLSINAGANIMCVCHDFDLQAKAQKRLLQALKTNELLMSTLDERVERVLKYKEQHIELHLELPYEAIEKNIRKSETLQYVSEVTQKAVTLVKGKKLLIDQKTLIVHISPKATTIADETDQSLSAINHLSDVIKNIELLTIALNPDQEQSNKVIELAKQFKKVVVMSYNANIYNQQQQLIKQLTTMDIELHVLAMRNPYDLYFIPDIQNYVCFYEYTPNSIQAFIAYLKGDLNPEGRLPIHER
jgi:beta-N-acetylhexosaminidase